MAAFVIGFRETLEAAVMIGVLLAFVNRMGQRRLAQGVWCGGAAGLLLGFAVATGLESGNIVVAGPALVAIQAIALGLALVALVGVAVCLRRRLSLAAGEWLVVAAAFFAVLPQVIELVSRLVNAETGVVVTLGPAVLGMVAASTLGGLLYVGLMRVELSQRSSAKRLVQTPAELSTVKQEVN